MADVKDQQFEALFAYYDRIVLFFKRLNFSPEDARDLTQEVFLRVYEHMDAWRGDSRWSYLQQVARRLAINVIRDRQAAKRKAIVVSDDALLTVHDDKAIPADVQLGRKAEVQRLYDAIDQLSPDLKTAVLYWLAGCSYHDMEAVLGISEATVKSRLHEARKRLKDLLGEELVGFRGEV
jgi:RNA polymerase sigma-70 factor (ECF subfamily)